MTKNELIIYLLVLTTGFFAGVIITGELFKVSPSCKSNGMNADSWFNAYTIAENDYVELIRCASSYDQCSYVIEDCINSKKD